MVVHIEDRADDHRYSDGSTLTQWLVKLGAPALPECHSYRLEFAEGGMVKPMEVTATITAQSLGYSCLVAQYTERTRSNAMGAAVAAARHAYEAAGYAPTGD